MTYHTHPQNPAILMRTTRDVASLSEWGSSPVFHVRYTHQALCAECVNEMLAEIARCAEDAEEPEHEIDAITAHAANYENHDLRCDECGERIPAAYDDPEDDAIRAEESRE